MTEVILLDGGMGQELIHRSPDQPTPLWSADVMIRHPGLVADIHRDYFSAGATVATANTYMAHADRLDGTHLEDQQAKVVDLALAEVVEAKADNSQIRVAGSIGPLRASYRPDFHPEHEEAVKLYAAVAALLAPRVDIILCETVASLRHARSVLEGARQSDGPVWVAVTLDDEDGHLLRSGEFVEELKGLEPDAWLANCSAPEAMGAAMEVFAGFGKPFGAYANGFTEITKEFLQPKPTADNLFARRDITPDVYADFALEWVDQGATIVGGCCEIGPSHISAIAARLSAAGHVIV